MATWTCDTFADKALAEAIKVFDGALFRALNPTASKAEQRLAERTVKNATRMVVRAGRDVERQRAFERGIEAFAKMPMFRMREAQQRDIAGDSRWTGD